MTELKEQLSLLGRKTEYKQDYAPEVLEAFDNKHPENDYWVRFNCPEGGMRRSRFAPVPRERFLESAEV